MAKKPPPAEILSDEGAFDPYVTPGTAEYDDRQKWLSLNSGAALEESSDTVEAPPAEVDALPDEAAEGGSD